MGARSHDPLVRRLGVQTFGIIGLGRIGTAAALRAKAFGFRVVFFDPYLPNGAELALGIERAATLEELLRQTDALSRAHAADAGDARHAGRAELALLPQGAVVVNTARGPIIDIDALGDAAAQRAPRRRRARRGAGRAAGRAGAGTDPRLSRARAVARGAADHHAALGVLLAAGVGRHPPQIGRDDARRAARADRPQNVIAPEME